MNKYWIHQCTGEKAFIKKGVSNRVEFKDTADGHIHKESGYISEEALSKFWMPITKAEYDSSLTLEEIKRNRNKNNKDNSSNMKYLDCFNVNGIWHIIGEILESKVPISPKHFENEEPAYRFGYIYQFIKHNSGGVEVYIKLIPNTKHPSNDEVYSTKIENLDKIFKPCTIKSFEPASKKKEEMKDTFESICEDMTATHKAKDHDYGSSFHNLFKELGINYAYGHLREKLERVKTLKDNEAKVKGESMIDSLKDLANYAIMTIIELQDGNED